VISAPTPPAIFLARGQPVLVASRVAEAFGIETREIAQAIKRNPEKFTEAHAFELSPEEAALLRPQGVISKQGRGGSRASPWVLTQKGVARLATVISSPAALAATDLIIDLFVEVYTQVAEGRTQIAISNPSRLAPDSETTRQVGRLRTRLLAALDGLLDTVIDDKRHTTVRDELGEVGGGALDFLKAHLQTRGLENEKIEAETVLILEQVRDLRDRARADTRKVAAETEGILLDNLDRKIGIVERLLAMADRLEPNAVVTLYSDFAAGAKLPTGELLSLPAPVSDETEDGPNGA